jgi:thioredoxin 1
MTNYNDNELSELISSNEKVMLYFSAEWCGPCKILKPNMEKAESEFGEEIKFAKADVSEAEETTKKYSIKNIPTCVLVSKGEEVARFSGVKNNDQIKKFFQEHRN